MNELALFAGAGGGILGGKLLGWKTVCAVEFDEHARNVLIARQNDRSLEPFPIWDDVSTFDGKPWRGIVDVVSGGFPCQDISSAGTGKGLDGERSGLWSEMSRIIGEVRPRFALIENSPMLTIRGGVRVIADLARMGYDCKWGVIRACDAGGVHNRSRIWIVANMPEITRGKVLFRQLKGKRNMGNNEQSSTKIDRIMARFERETKELFSQKHDYPSYLMRVDDAMAFELDRLERIGNGQVPAVVKLAWELLGGL